MCVCRTRPSPCLPLASSGRRLGEHSAQLCRPPSRPCLLYQYTSPFSGGAAGRRSLRWFVFPSVASSAPQVLARLLRVACSLAPGCLLSTASDPPYLPWQGHTQGLMPSPALPQPPYQTCPFSYCTLPSANRLPPFFPRAPVPRCTMLGFPLCSPPPPARIGSHLASLRPLKTSSHELPRCAQRGRTFPSAPLQPLLSAPALPGAAARPPSGPPLLSSKTILVTPLNTIFYVKPASSLSTRGAHSSCPAQP